MPQDSHPLLFKHCQFQIISYQACSLFSLGITIQDSRGVIISKYGISPSFDAVTNINNDAHMCAHTVSGDTPDKSEAETGSTSRPVTRERNRGPRPPLVDDGIVTDSSIGLEIRASSL